MTNLNQRSLFFSKRVGSHFILSAEIDSRAWEPMDWCTGDARAVWQPSQIAIFDEKAATEIALLGVDFAFADNDPAPDYYTDWLWEGNGEQDTMPAERKAIDKGLGEFIREIAAALEPSARQALNDLDKPQKPKNKPVTPRAVSNFKRCVSRRLHSRDEFTREALREWVETHVKKARCWHLIDSLSSSFPKTLDELLKEFGELAARRPDRYSAAGYTAQFRAAHSELWVLYEGKCLAYACIGKN